LLFQAPRPPRRSRLYLPVAPLPFGPPSPRPIPPPLFPILFSVSSQLPRLLLRLPRPLTHDELFPQTRSLSFPRPPTRPCCSHGSHLSPLIFVVRVVLVVHSRPSPVRLLHFLWVRWYEFPVDPPTFFSCVRSLFDPPPHSCRDPLLRPELLIFYPPDHVSGIIVFPPLDFALGSMQSEKVPPFLPFLFSDTSSSYPPINPATPPPPFLPPIPSLPWDGFCKPVSTLLNLLPPVSPFSRGTFVKVSPDSFFCHSQGDCRLLFSLFNSSRRKSTPPGFFFRTSPVGQKSKSCL